MFTTILLWIFWHFIMPGLAAFFEKLIPEFLTARWKWCHERRQKVNEHIQKRRTETKWRRK